MDCPNAYGDLIFLGKVIDGVNYFSAAFEEPVRDRKKSDTFSTNVIA